VLRSGEDVARLVNNGPVRAPQPSREPALAQTQAASEVPDAAAVQAEVK
jgi:hypothetical protein